jgi:uncharacterized protein
MKTSQEILQQNNHRIYPMPNPKTWLMYQSWQRLLFVHWPVPAAMLRDKIPSELTIDEFEGTAWLGVVPFRMANVHLRGLPPIWGTSRFPELNVRSYVKKDGYAGVWFFSLDAANPLAVIGAKITFHLPYYLAQMSIHENQAQTYYESRRGSAVFVGDYAPSSGVEYYAVGTLEHWLTERYYLFAANKHGRVYRGDIHHQQWPLQAAEADISVNTMAAASGLSLPDTKPHLLYAEEIDMLAWYIK